MADLQPGEKIPFVYERDGKKVKIQGDFSEVKGLVWVDLIWSKLERTALVVVSFIAASKCSIIQVICKLLKK